MANLIQFETDAARWESGGADSDDMRVTILDSSSPTIVRTFMGIPLERVRITIPPSGGSFERVERGNAPLQFRHDPDRVLGRMVSAEVVKGEDGEERVVATVRFRKNSDEAQAIKADLENDTYPKGVSVGINVDKFTEGKAKDADGEEITTHYIDAWHIRELSIASDPVYGGVGFSESAKSALPETETETESQKGVVEMSQETNTLQVAPPADNSQELARVKAEMDAAAAERKRIMDFALGENAPPNAHKEALDALSQGESAVDFMQRMASQTFAPKPHSASVSAELANRKTFSLAGFLETQVDRPAKVIQERFAPETELMDKWTERIILESRFRPAGGGPRGGLLPLEAVMGGRLDLAVMGVADYGPHAVPQETLPWVERYAAGTPVLAWANMMSGLQGATERIPVVNSATTPAATDDKSIAPDSTPSITSVTMEPHQISVQFSYTPLVNIQTGGATDMYLRRQAARDMMSAMERGVVAGDGSGNNVRGVARYANLGVLDMGSDDFSYDYAADLEDVILDANVEDDGSWGFLLSRADFKAGRKEPIDAGSGLFLIEMVQSVGADGLQQSRFANVRNFYRAARSTYLGAAGGVPAATAKIIFGRWDDLMVGTWATTQVIVDPYSSKPDIEIVIVMWYDTALPRPASFVRGHSS